MADTTRHETHEIVETVPDPETAGAEAQQAAQELAAAPAAAAVEAAQEPSPAAATAAAERVEARLEAEALTRLETSLTELRTMQAETLAHLRSLGQPSNSSSSPEAPEPAAAVGELETVVQAPPEVTEPIAEEAKARGNPQRRGLLHKRRR